jgi:large subunit ribosomal protein L4
MDGTSQGSLQIDEAVLGGEVRPGLLKQAIVRYQNGHRQGTAATKSRGMVRGSTRKLYKQKGTGRARMGNNRQPVRRGGGHAFRKETRDFSQALPKKMRRLARNNAILAKIQSNEALIIDGLGFDSPKTKAFAGMLEAVGVKKSCVVALREPNENIWKSGRNIPKTDICLVQQLNAYEILRRQKLVFAKDAFETLVADPVRIGLGHRPTA